MKAWVVVTIVLMALLMSGCSESTAGTREARQTTEEATSVATSTSTGEKEGRGSLSHSEDEQFCSEDECIANFANGHGEVVECNDGKWSHSGGISGACSDHGGERHGQTETPPSSEGEKEGSQSEGEKEGPGSESHSEDEQFCSEHECIANFANGSGKVVECDDGKWSHSGGISGACSGHGGERQTGESGSEEHSAEESGTAESSSQNSESTNSSSAALDALDSYWADIKDHNFSGAYGYLGPGAAGRTESQFVTSEEEAGISSAEFQGRVTSSSSSSATVAVVSLITHDVQYGCRTWSGSYTMGDEDGQWRIQRAALSPHSCSG